MIDGKSACAVEENATGNDARWKRLFNEKRLTRRRVRDRARYAARSSEERVARIQQITDRQQQRLASETTDERAARLQHHEHTSKETERAYIKNTLKKHTLRKNIYVYCIRTATVPQWHIQKQPQ